jgi:predicted ribosome quality control (RQC) complex YloA/Tae2 family protein
MVKVRFNALDVAASVNSLRLELRGMRLNNIYDIDNKVPRSGSLLCCVLT